MEAQFCMGRNQLKGR